MTRHRLAALGALVAASLALSGCGSPEATGPASDTLAVGVFFPGSISDTGFMQSGYLGYQRIAEQLGDQVELSYVERVAPADYEQALVRFASQNELVISLGGQTDADLRKVAPSSRR